MATKTSLTIPVSEDLSVSGLLTVADEPIACYVFAHGAGAGMDHPFMAAVADGLAARHVTTLRYQFPYMERGSKRVDSPAVAQRTVRAAVRTAVERFSGLPVFAGGKSFGGRMTSGAQASEPMASLQGIAFVGFPLHPAGQPSIKRAEHLSAVTVPMLFLQGTRDTLADIGLVRQVASGLGARASLHEIDAADHGFHVLVRSGRTDAEVMTELLDTMVGWFVQRAASR